MELKTRIEENLRYALAAIQTMISEGNTDRVNDYLGLFGDMLIFYRTFWDLELDWAYAKLVKIFSEPADLMVAAAMDVEYLPLGESAAKFAVEFCRMFEVLVDRQQSNPADNFPSRGWL